MKRASLKIVGVAALLLAGAIPAPPAVADEKTQAGGAIAFEGASTLQNFPCPPPQPGQFPCTGVWNGRLAGSLSGVHTVDGEDRPWAVEIVIPASAVIAYFDLVQPGLPCSEGFARANGVATGGTNQVFGAYGNALPVPAPVTNITVSWAFEWRRIGLHGVLRFSNVDVTLTVLGEDLPVHVMVDGGGYGAATFTPVLEAAHLAGCQSGNAPSPEDDLEAGVTGTAALYDVQPSELT